MEKGRKMNNFPNFSCPSSLRIYDHTVDGLIEPTDRADYEFCAREIAMGRAFYSK